MHTISSYYTLAELMKSFGYVLSNIVYCMSMHNTYFSKQYIMSNASEDLRGSQPSDSIQN